MQKHRKITKKRTLNKDRVCIAFLALLLSVSIIGNVVQNVSYAKADKLTKQDIATLEKDLEKEKKETEKTIKVDIYGQQMTLDKLKKEYVIAVDELNDLKEQNQ